MTFNQRDELGFVVLMMLVIILAVLIRHFIKIKREKLKRLEEGQHNRAQSDQNRVYNISSHVQSQNQTQYPDGYLSVEHITITNELNKPPKYDDAPPTYEEAVKLAMARSNSMQTFQAEQQQNHEQPQTSSSATAPAMVHAVPHRTTE